MTTPAAPPAAELNAGGTPPAGDINPGGTPPANPPTNPPANPPSFSVPEKYAKEAWAQGIKSPDDLWGQYANAQTLIGKKGVIVPAENATEAELREFYQKLGCPEKPEAYEFKVLEPLKDSQRDADLDAVAKTVLHKHGVSKKVGEQLIHDLEAAIYEKNKPLLERMTGTEKAFNVLNLATFGEKAEVAQKQFKEVLETSLKKDYPQLIPKLNELPAEGLVILKAFAKQMHDTYVGEYKLKPGGTPPAAGDVKSQYQQISEAKLAVRQDPNIPAHIRDAKLAELNRQLREVGKKAAEAGIDLFV